MNVLYRLLITVLVSIFIISCQDDNQVKYTLNGDNNSSNIINNNETNGSLHSAKKIRIMPLGDSITYDYAHAYYDKNGKNLVPAGKRTGYRVFLARRLDEAGVKYDFVGSRRAGYSIEPPFDPDNEGHPGWTSYQIADHVKEFLEKNPADIILLHIGTNDHSSKIDGTKRAIANIEEFAKAHKMKIRIFVALIINREYVDYTIKAYNKNLEKYLDSLNDPYVIKVDMRGLLSMKSGDYIENTHPNKQGYEKMADKWFSAIIDYLK